MQFFIFILAMAVIISFLYAKAYLPLIALLRHAFAKRAVPYFDNQYVDVKSFFVFRFRVTPCIATIDDVDATQAFAFISTEYKGMIADTLQLSSFNKEKGVQEFCKTIFVLKNKVIVALSESYAAVFYTPAAYDFADNIVKMLAKKGIAEKQEEFEINIIRATQYGLDWKRLDINPTRLDISLYYNDDFKAVDALIRNRLNNKGDKGIVLLHGLPGTGKTTYLRYLIGQLKKKVLFVSPSVAGNLTNPEFIDLLIDNPNAVVIIEDAENILMDRKFNSDSTVSNLLNLSDGLLSDCISVQIICTFNSPLQTVDSALMRKGRLIAKYEFGKLETCKAQQLSDHLGFATVLRSPMTVAEIANQADMGFAIKEAEAIGFKRQKLMPA